MLIWLVSLFAASIVILLLLITRFGVHPFLALLICAMGYGVGAGMPYEWVLRSIRDGMSTNFGTIGVLLLAGAIVTMLLERSGVGQRLTEAGRLRRHRFVAGVTIVGWLGGLGAWPEAAFVFLAPVVRLLAGANRCLAVGAQLGLGFAILAAQALVVPAPVAIITRTVFDANMLQVFRYGAIAAAAGVSAGLAFLALAATRGWLARAGSGGAGAATAGRTAGPGAPDTGKSAVGSRLRLRWLAFVPAVLALLLLMTGSVGQLPGEPLGPNSGNTLAPLGGPLVMLGVAFVFALFLLARRSGPALPENEGWLGSAIARAAPAVMITAAGAGFARVLQNSPLSDVVGEAVVGGLPAAVSGAGLLVPFVLAAALRIAQGSAAVAVLTASGFCVPLLAGLGLDDAGGRAFAALAVGAGAIIGSHANDSLFWVVTRTIGLSPAAGYRLQTLGTSVVGLAAILALLALRSILA